ncbi:MAG TPA: TetR family transcriptional regulator [Acidimicrobiia bacterium]
MSETLSTLTRQRTPEHLVRTAERLFAERGITAVSLRQIVAAAGHKNPAAVQYHFGSKEGLLRAIVEFRAGHFNARRIEMLQALRDDERGDLRGVVEAVVLPFAQDEPPGSYYVRFLAQLSAHPTDLGRVFGSLDEDFGLSVQLLKKELDRHLDHLAPRIRWNRVAMAMSLAVHALADRQAALSRDENLVPDDQMFVSDLIDATVGLLSARSTVDE